MKQYFAIFDFFGRLKVNNSVLTEMRKIIVLSFIIVTAFTVTDVQKERIVLAWDSSVFSELADKDFPILAFKNAEYDITYPGIPVFFKSFDIKDNQDLKFVMEDPIYVETKIPTDLPEFEHLTNEVQLKKQKLKSGENYKIQVQILPFKKENGRIFVLTSFSLKQFPVSLKSTAIESYIWKNESVLKQGSWKRISISEKGIYRIPYSKLSEWGFTNPANVNVFGSGGVILSENPGEKRYDDLPQVSVWHGKNNGTDCLFFFAPGTIEWSPNFSKGLFEHKQHDYATKGYFYLSESAGSTKIAEKTERIGLPSTNTVNSFSAYDLYEDELENILPLGSGKQWYGNKFKSSSSKNIIFSSKNIETSSNVTTRVKAVARSFRTSEMKVFINQTEEASLNFSQVNTGSATDIYANEQSKNITTSISDDEITVTLRYYANGGNNNTDENAVAWLDFVELNFRKKLIAGNDPLFFRDLYSVGETNISEFIVANSSSETRIFDVTEWYDLKEIPFELNGNTATFKAETGELREFVVFSGNGNFPEPEFVDDIPNQNMHAMKTPELVIITHSSFLGSANQLADFHRNFDDMDVEVVTATQVYNEFSSGNKDATGIRNFIKMLYDRNEQLKYVLLLGDGSFDNKNVRPDTKNFIPTFQSANSLSPTSSFVSDDYFVLLDENESVYNGAVDLGIGRIPASTSYEAELVVNKIVNYYSPESFGEWRNAVCFIGDDEDGGLHMRDSEKLANKVNENHGEFITDKIYFDAFPQETTPAGERYPDVTAAINNSVKDGVLVLNYVGHANERFMADEHVLDISNVNSWSNETNLPIFVTATCEFSRYDADDTSIGEYVLFNPNGGGIGLFSTTRVVYASDNFVLSNNFYDFVFETDENGSRYRMGDIMKQAKIKTAGSNKRNFSLLADPALRLSYPKHKVITTHINGKDAGNYTDTIGALQQINIEGIVADYFGNKLGNFSGDISITVYDKGMIMSTLGNGGENPINFKVQENIIYKGKANVSDGAFTFSFVIPKDISYALGEGKIIYYASNGNMDAHGAFTNFVIGGSSGNGIADNEGPEIDLYMDNTEFISGGRTGKNPTLLAFLSDENGINTVGTGIGHDIAAVLDNDYANVIILNKYYRSDLNNYTSGSINYRLQNLSVGKHKLVLKAWDVANNSTETEIEFEVSGDFTISQVLNYPNPATDYTYFTFEHNQSGEILDVLIEIFDQMGRRVDYIMQEVGSNGTTSNPVRWNFREMQTLLLGGIYPYRVTVKNNEGVIASDSGKIIISR